MDLKIALNLKLYFERSKREPSPKFGEPQIGRNVRLMSLVSEEKIFFWITVVPHTFPVPRPAKHNKNLKCEITEHWFVFVYSKFDFWT